MKKAKKRKMRHDLIYTRLDIVEEAANIMLYIAGLIMDDYIGLPVVINKEMIQGKKQRWEEIAYASWAALEVINSSELKDNYSKIASAYSDAENNGFVAIEKWEDAYKGYKEFEKRIDDIKLGILSS